MKKKIAKEKYNYRCFLIIDINFEFFFIDTKKNKFKISKRFLVERRVAKIDKHQNFKIILKLFSRRSIKLKRFKLFSLFSKFENAFDNNSFLNINIVNVVIFHKQTNEKNKKNSKCFQ